MVNLSSAGSFSKNMRFKHCLKAPEFHSTLFGLHKVRNYVSSDFGSRQAFFLLLPVTSDKENHTTTLEQSVDFPGMQCDVAI
jgi:hypothetical protein